jgi:hypothetical protein
MKNKTMITLLFLCSNTLYCQEIEAEAIAPIPQTTVWSTLKGCFIKKATSETVPTQPLTCMQKTKQCTWRCCFPKVTKIACSYCLCGKNCLQTVQTFGEYKIIKTALPWLQDPYCLGATLTIAGCAGCSYGLYKTKSCCFKKKDSPSSINILMEDYTNNENK